MPIYEYECPDCAHHFEAMQRMSEDPIRLCPNCGQQHVRRVLSAPAIHFKGSGFYNTDYGTRKRAAEKSDGGDGSGAKEAKPATGGDTGSSGGSGGGDGGSAGDKGSSGKTVGLDKV